MNGLGIPEVVSFGSFVFAVLARVKVPIFLVRILASESWFFCCVCGLLLFLYCWPVELQWHEFSGVLLCCFFWLCCCCFLFFDGYVLVVAALV
jgi:hypothetical protein